MKVWLPRLLALPLLLPLLAAGRPPALRGPRSQARSEARVIDVGGSV